MNKPSYSADTEIMGRKLWTRRMVLKTAALAAGSVAIPFARSAFALEPPPFVAWHGRTLADHTALRNQWTLQGYRFVSLSIYGSVAAPVYAAVMIKRLVIVAQTDSPYMTATQWQQTFDEQAAQGFGPVILTATGSASDPRFAAVFQPQDPIPLTRHGLTSGDVTDLGTIQGMNNSAKSQGLILRWAASYGSATDPRFAAIWMPNTDIVLWNNDGLVDAAEVYQARFDAETSVWCRPSFVTLDGDNCYLSLFVADEIGPWIARHDMSPGDYQREFNTWTAQNYYPICVQAAGSSAVTARFAALFVQTEEIVSRNLNATGPIENEEIDAVVRETMGTYPVARHAALAIVHGKKLVYARGYTVAEPSWPIVQPTTHFRLASVSKTITALAIFQLIERKMLALSDTMQSILQLRTPSGGAPPVGFNQITIQHLLEHTSGLQTDSFTDGVAVVQAFEAAGYRASLPVTQAMTDSYIASLQLVSSPGTVQAYSNCGYYLLGRIVAHLRGTAAPIDAYQQYLFGPLGITRIRAAVDLVSAQQEDEARYEAAAINQDFPSDLQVASSLMTVDQPLVASGYGNDELAIAQGAAGLSAAVTDLARLVAILIDQDDNPALKRATITGMLSAAAKLKSALGPNGRAGYGLDDASNLGGGNFYAQKGGLIIDAASVLQFDDQWGFVLCFGSPAQLPNPPYPAPSWYPDFPGVMDIAKKTDWGTTDLFPLFGMPWLCGLSCFV
jgi:CubicO group peptidase (beta-lactamase class C family)